MDADPSIDFLFPFPLPFAQISVCYALWVHSRLNPPFEFRI